VLSVTRKSLDVTSILSKVICNPSLITDGKPVNLGILHHYQHAVFVMMDMHWIGSGVTVFTCLTISIKFMCFAEMLEYKKMHVMCVNRL
jgi:hypothetical protein